MKMANCEWNYNNNNYNKVSDLSRSDEDLNHRANNEVTLTQTQAGPSCITHHNNVRTSCTSSSSEASSRQNSVDSCSSSDGCGSMDYPGRLSASSSPNRSVPSSPTGPKFKLIHEGDIHVCRLNHTRTVISKIMSSKFLRRWENHHLYLDYSEICSKTPSGFMEEPVQYSQIEDIYVVTRWEVSHKYCIRVVISDGSLLLQVSNAYTRDQWMHSLLWKRTVFKSQKLLLNSRRPEVLLREIRNLVDLALTTPLQDECIYQTPLDILSECLLKGQSSLSKHFNEELIATIAPLLERTTPTSEICDFLCKHCQVNPRSRIVLDLFTPVVQRILKHNMDFGKCPKSRVFVQHYLQALNCQNDGQKVIENFLNSMHGLPSTCPHPRVLPNLVSICLAAIYSLFEERKSTLASNSSQEMTEWSTKLDCIIAIFETIVSFEDWRLGLSQLLQPLPFPEDALQYQDFTIKLKSTVRSFAVDSRCEVHLMVLGIREEKEGWLDLYAPGGIACDDEGDLWSLMLDKLVSCCCRRKHFLQSLNKSLGSCILRALRDDEACQRVLCAMLELDIVENKDLQLQIITTLQSTPSGKEYYASLCQHQRHLKELQQKGGPRKLTLPSRSTDADVAKLLSCGSFGNLECLSLAFTRVTSACAEQLIKLPSLRYLNLWSTQFGDIGLQLISEHLHKLQVLNLCETPVTDKGLVSLSALKALRKLNLNSTNLSAQMFEGLKQKLPELQECDVRYTDAW